MLADGVTGDGVTKMADSKMAAPTTPKMADSLNLARRASPSTSTESGETTPPRPRTPELPPLLPWQPMTVLWRGNGRRFCHGRSRRERSLHVLPPRRKMNQCVRGGGPPHHHQKKKKKKKKKNEKDKKKKKVQRVQSPVQEQVPSGQQKTTTGAGRGYPDHENYDLDEGDKRRYYIVKANGLPRSEE